MCPPPPSLPQRERNWIFFMIFIGLDDFLIYRNSSKMRNHKTSKTLKYSHLSPSPREGFREGNAKMRCQYSTELNPKYILYFLIAVFFLRALGDFKYIGFFKKIRNTSFAKSDTWFFSPLCLLISLLILMFLHGECGFIPFPFTFG